MKNIRIIFDSFSTKTSKFTGSPICFSIAVLMILVWLICGPIFKFSETWQLVINTATTIITFLMVFLLQYSQNKDTKALHIKLDSIIGGLDKVDDKMKGIENKTVDELNKIEKDL